MWALHFQLSVMTKNTKKMHHGGLLRYNGVNWYINTSGPFCAELTNWIDGSVTQGLLGGAGLLKLPFHSETTNITAHYSLSLGKRSRIS